MTDRIIIGDALQSLKTLESESVHCCVTSPPYFGLRSYLEKDDPDKLLELGSEKTPEEYLEKMVIVFREVKRVLRSDAVLFLNMGDSYASGKGTCFNPGGGDCSLEANRKDKGAYPLDRGNKSTLSRSGLKPKDLIGMPWALAFALRDDGWWLRSDIIWAKPNPMPESVTDRPTKSHEYLFLLTKSANYYFDQEAVREPVAESTIGRGPVDFGGAKGRQYKTDIQPNDPNYRGGSEQWGRMFDYKESCKNGRNLRSVWTIPTEPTKDAHFATFPRKLVEPFIKAGTSERGACPQCLAPWVRVVEKRGGTTGKSWHDHNSDSEKGQSQGSHPGGVGAREAKAGNPYQVVSTGWRPSCSHGFDPIPSTVLDCFAGTGTTGRVARDLGRNFILIELNPKYLQFMENKVVDAFCQPEVVTL